MDEKKEIIFPDGLFVEKAGEGAPDLLRSKMSFEVEKFYAFMKKHEKVSGYVNINMWKSERTGKLYTSLDTWEPVEDANKKFEDISKDADPF